MKGFLTPPPFLKRIFGYVTSSARLFFSYLYESLMFITNEEKNKYALSIIHIGEG